MPNIHPPVSPPLSTVRKPAGRRWPGRSTSLVVGLAAALVLALLVLALTWPRPLSLTVFFDHVDGLQAGDAVYLDGLRIGRVRNLRLTGRRVAVEIEIEPEHRQAVSRGSHFFLWRDELDHHRRALRVQPAAE